MKRRLLSILLTVAIVLSAMTVMPILSASANDNRVYPQFRCGDVDGNGVVNITDALEILMSLAGMDSALKNNPDANKAGRITNSSRAANATAPDINDALEILMHLAGMNTTFLGTHADAFCDWCRQGPPPGPTVTFQNLTAQQLTASMWKGWNIGNTFDFHAGPELTATIDRYELGWLGNNTDNRVTPALIRAVKAQGFDTIRVPVTWYKAADKNNNWNIRPMYMERIKAVVDMILAEDMFVILNTHHEEFYPNNPARAEWGGFDLYNDNMTASSLFVRRMWEQIGATFRTYDHRLIFEVLNEPRHIGSPQEWSGGSAEERANLNILNQLAVDTIRTTGDNNRWRILMVPTYAASPRAVAFDGFTIPNDPTNPGVNKIALSVHAYQSERFCFIGVNDNFDPAVDGVMIQNSLRTVANEAARLGVPVIMGEWGSVNKDNTAARAAHAEFYTNFARCPCPADVPRHAGLTCPRRIVTVWWDNGAVHLGVSGNRDGFGLIRRDAPHGTQWTLLGSNYNFQPIIDGIKRGVGNGPPPRVVVNFNQGGGTTTTLAPTQATPPPVTTNNQVIPPITTTMGDVTNPPVLTPPTPPPLTTSPPVIVITEPTPPPVTTTPPTTLPPLLTTSAPPIGQPGVLFDMQTVAGLERVASGQGGLTLLVGNGGTRTVNMGTPRSITITGRTGNTSRGVDIVIAELGTRAGHSYRFEVAGTLGTGAGNEARVRLVDSPNTNLGTANTGASGAFSITFTLTHEEIRAHAAAGQRYNIGGTEGQDLVITTLRITEITGTTPPVTPPVITTPPPVITTPPPGTTPTPPVTPPPSGNFQNLTAHQVVANMGVGWNLGNTFDAFDADSSSYSNPIRSNQWRSWFGNDYAGLTVNRLETAWLEAYPIRGSESTVTRQLINNVKAAGFDTIRIPVTWHKAISGSHTSSSFTIRDDWMRRIKEVVDWAIAADMYVILNTHHEEYILPFSNSSETTQSRATLARLWTLIGNEFRDYGERLIFEVLNEPRVKNHSNEWTGGTGDHRRNLNQLNQAAVDAIRATGSNNRFRILMIPTYAASPFAYSWGNAFDGFVRPSDSTNTVNKLILSIHAYSPNNYTGISGVQSSWSQSEITNMMNTVRTQANNLQMPVVLGEWGAVARHNDPTNSAEVERARYAQFYVTEAVSRGFVPVWWDTGILGPVNTVEGRWGLFNRRTGAVHYTNITNAIAAGLAAGRR
jgi:endoglucanase